MTDRPLASSPELFADRCLGKVTIRRLRQRGWIIHLFDEVFVDDGQQVSDEEWVAYAGQRGWAGLTKDKRIRRQPAYRSASTPIFALSNGHISIQDIVEWFSDAEDRILREAGNGRREFWMVYQGGRIERREP